jgi:hypothetical protein
VTDRSFLFFSKIFPPLFSVKKINLFISILSIILSPPAAAAANHHLCHLHLTTTSPLYIAATIKCSFHPPLSPLFLSLIPTVKRQHPPPPIADVISLVAGHFCRQSMTAALRRYRCQPPPAVAVPANVWLLFVSIAPHLIHLLPLCDRQPYSCQSLLPPIVECFPQAVSLPVTTHLCLS